MTSPEATLLAALAGLKIAALYAAVIVLMGVVLTYLVINQRRLKKIGIGDGGDRDAARMIRVHGNFCENAPFALALLILLPLAGAGSLTIHAVGVLFVIGRIAHAVGLAGSAGTSIGRMVGMIMTHTALVWGAVALLLAAIR